jgi:hypothetical protein
MIFFSKMILHGPLIFWQWKNFNHLPTYPHHRMASQDQKNLVAQKGMWGDDFFFSHLLTYPHHQMATYKISSLKGVGGCAIILGENIHLPLSLLGNQKILVTIQWCGPKNFDCHPMQPRHPMQPHH